MHIYFSNFVCGSQTMIHLYIMDFDLVITKSKVQFPTHKKWQLQLWNHLFSILLLLKLNLKVRAEHLII